MGEGRRRNPNKYIWRIISLTLISPLNSDPSSIDAIPANQTILEGSNITLHCNSTGNPTPNITWTKDGNLTVLYQGETYNIVNIQRQAAGDYTCTAWNGVGEQKNATATVTVHCKLPFYCSFVAAFYLFAPFSLLFFLTTEGSFPSGFLTYYQSHENVRQVHRVMTPFYVMKKQIPCEVGRGHKN